MFKLIGFAGLAGVGKDTCADFLVRRGFVKVNMADPLKRICRDVFAFTDDQLWGPSSMRNAPDPRYLLHKAKGSPSEDVYLTPRHALQQLGTEWGRGCYMNVWVDYALRIVDRLRPTEYGARAWTYDPIQGLSLAAAEAAPIEGVVVADVRFPNEVAAIKRAGGVVARVVRPGAGLSGEAGGHFSEHALDGVEFKYTIDNSSSLLELRRRVDRFLATMDDHEPRSSNPPPARSG